MFGDTTYNGLAESGEAVVPEFVMDEEAFRGFYERNARAVWAYLVRLTGSREQADDLMQETFYRFLRAAAVHESESHRRNSLYVIATNVARDARRRAMVRLPFSSGADVETCGGAHPAGAADRSADLERALGQMKPRERAMLWLAYAEGATHGEIAAAVGVQASSLKSMLHRARRKLAGLLGEGSAR